MPKKSPTAMVNRLLSRLSADDFALLARNLNAVDLPIRKRLENRNTRIDHVYFLESGFASVVGQSSGRSIEVGMIGREGMTGLAVVLGTDRSINDTFIQGAGSGWRITAENLRQAMAQSPSLQAGWLLYAHAFGAQTTSTAVANGRSKIEERLARWILMASDRVDSDELDLTHEFLSMMLGVRRPGVTLALHLLVQSGLIQVARGIIRVIDREGMEEISNGAYGVPEAEFQRLFG
jgi:CRP-like cAMP-binding protein